MGPNDSQTREKTWEFQHKLSSGLEERHGSVIAAYDLLEL
jgi:hypothetical protein